MPSSARRRLAVVALAGLVPWTVLLIRQELTLVFTFGLFNTNPPTVVSIYDFFYRYTLGLPRFIEAWGIGVAVYLIGLGSALAGLVDREDPRVTAGLLTVAALTQLSVFAGFDRRIGYTAIPVGTVVLLTVVWWYYWPLVDLRSLVAPERR